MKTSDYGKYYPEDFKTVKTGDIVTELAREQAMRQNVYPAQIKKGKLKREDAVQRFRTLRLLLHLFNLAEANNIEPEDIKQLFETHIGSEPKQKSLTPKNPN